MPNIRTISQNYFNPIQSYKNNTNNKTNKITSVVINLAKIASYFTIVIPTLFAFTYVISTLVDRVSTKHPKNQQKQTTDSTSKISRAKIAPKKRKKPSPEKNIKQKKTVRKARLPFCSDPFTDTAQKFSKIFSQERSKGRNQANSFLSLGKLDEKEKTKIIEDILSDVDSITTTLEKSSDKSKIKQAVNTPFHPTGFHGNQEETLSLLHLVVSLGYASSNPEIQKKIAATTKKLLQLGADLKAKDLTHAPEGENGNRTQNSPLLHVIYSGNGPVLDVLIQHIETLPPQEQEAILMYRDQLKVGGTRNAIEGAFSTMSIDMAEKLLKSDAVLNIYKKHSIQRYGRKNPNIPLLPALTVLFGAGKDKATNEKIEDLIQRLIEKLSPEELAEQYYSTVTKGNKERKIPLGFSLFATDVGDGRGDSPNGQYRNTLFTDGLRTEYRELFQSVASIAESREIPDYYETKASTFKRDYFMKDGNLKKGIIRKAKGIADSIHDKIQDAAAIPEGFKAASKKEKAFYQSLLQG